MQSSAEPAPYARLTPDTVLDAIESLGWVTDGRLLALNSYENRVFQAGFDAAPGAAPGAASNAADSASRFIVVKFYRAGRWTDQQILEEHAFADELARGDIPVVAPLADGAGCSLHRHEGFRFAVFPRRGGRVPNLDDPDVLEWIGRFIGRIHAAGAGAPFEQRPALDPHSFGVEPSRYLLEHGWLPSDLRAAYEAVAAQALAEVERCYERAGGAVRPIRLHGDTHEGNILWTEGAGPHFVDLDDARMGPAVQDLWMLLGDPTQMGPRLRDLLAGYEDFFEFDRRELYLIEALRTLRLIHYSAWIARRWNDPAFPAAFPWFNTARYWEQRILELREQVAAMQEAPPRA